VMSERVLVTIEEGVCHVRLNRADKMNALDPAMFDAVLSTIEALSDDSSIRVIVLSGEGNAFCAGLDVSSFGASETVLLICSQEPTRKRILFSKWAGVGDNYLCLSLPPCTASALAVGCS